MVKWWSFSLIFFLVAAQFTAKVDFASAQSALAIREAIAEPKSAWKSQRPIRTDRAARLKSLYDALSKAPNAQIAKLIEAKIDALNARSGSDTVDLLMMRARIIMQSKDNELAFELLNAAIDIAPDFVDARVQRATLYYLTKDFGSALGDLRIALAKEPRRYGAYAGLGVILQDIGEDKRALEAFRRALLIYPYMDSVSEMVKKLTIKVEGRDI